MQLSALLPMLPSSLAGLALIFGGLIVTSSAMAQEDPLAARRAINHARNSAALANGGLRKYHPAGCMFKDTTDNPCLAQQDANGFQFKFQGGPPGWEVLGLPATVESTVLISPDGQTVIQELHQEIGASTSGDDVVY